MKTFISLMILLYASTVFAGELIKDKPAQIHEFENFRLKLNNIDKFRLTISNSCIKVLRMEHITGSSSEYSSQNGVIFFENGCFEGENITIKLDSGNVSEKLEIRLAPAHKEERDYGC